MLKCIVNDFASDNAKLWNEQRQMIANYALDKILFPSMTKWIKERLGGKASEFVIAQCSKSLAQVIIDLLQKKQSEGEKQCSMCFLALLKPNSLRFQFNRRIQYSWHQMKLLNFPSPSPSLESGSGNGAV